MSNLAEALMAEITRVRDTILPVYLEIGISGAPAAAMMRADLDLAVKALAEQDAIGCIRAFKALKDYSL